MKTQVRKIITLPYGDNHYYYPFISVLNVYVYEYDFYVLIILLIVIKHLLSIRHCAIYTTDILLCYLILTKILKKKFLL